MFVNCYNLLFSIVKMGGTLSMSSIRGNSEKVFSHLYKLWFKYELSHYQQSQLPCQEHRNKGNNLTCMGSFFFFFLNSNLHYPQRWSLLLQKRNSESTRSIRQSFYFPMVRDGYNTNVRIGRRG